MLYNIIPILITSIIILFNPVHLFAQDFQLAPNGVTVTCDAASVGDTGVVNGVTYTKRDRSGLDALLSTDQNNPELATSCTSGITDMSSLFSGNFMFNQEIESWDVSQVTDMSAMFKEANFFNSQKGDIGFWDVGQVTDMSEMFVDLPYFNEDIGSWDVSRVTDMNLMFWQAEAFNKDIGSWDVGSVTNMRGMFDQAEAFNQNIGSWDVDQVTDMSYMFNSALKFNQDIGDWNVSQVTEMLAMFSNAETFNQDISQWNVGQVTEMGSMFSGAEAFNQDIGNWEVGQVTDMGFMFQDASSFDQDIGSWDVSAVTEMQGMFNSFIQPMSFNKDISSWDVGQVNNMNSMFEENDVFNQDISGWNVSNVTDMNDMFEDSDAFNQDISSWCVELIPVEPRDFGIDSGFEGQPELQPQWGRCPATAELAGSEGFRMLSMPLATNSYDDLIGPLWTQGIASGADATSGTANVWSWNKTNSSTAASNYMIVNDLNSNPGAGTGFLMYVYEDDQAFTPGIQGGFPKEISTNSTSSGQFSPAVNANADGFTLLGNPFFRSIDFDALTTNDLSGVAYVWNPTTSQWDTWDSVNSTGDLADGIIAPLQGFFVKTVNVPASPSITIDESDIVSGGNFRGRPDKDGEAMAVRLEMSNEETELVNSAWLSFSASGSTTDRGRGDALKLESLNNDFAQLATSKADDNVLLDINHLTDELEHTVEIPLVVKSSKSGTFTLSATDFNIPQGYSLTFHNMADGSSLPINEDFETTLTIEVSGEREATSPETRIENPAGLRQEITSTPYSITIEPDNVTSTGNEANVPQTASLDQNYPNPFNPTTTIRFELPEEQEMRLEVYDLTGRSVACLVDSEMRSAGTHSVTFNASELSSGVYIYQLKTGSGTALTKKLTLIK